MLLLERSHRSPPIVRRHRSRRRPRRARKRPRASPRTARGGLCPRGRGRPRRRRRGRGRRRRRVGAGGAFSSAAPRRRPPASFDGAGSAGTIEAASAPGGGLLDAEDARGGFALSDGRSAAEEEGSGGERRRHSCVRFRVPGALPRGRGEIRSERARARGGGGMRGGGTGGVGRSRGHAPVTTKTSSDAAVRAARRPVLAGGIEESCSVLDLRGRRGNLKRSAAGGRADGEAGGVAAGDARGRGRTDTTRPSWPGCARGARRAASPPSPRRRPRGHRARGAGSGAGSAPR